MLEQILGDPVTRGASYDFPIVDGVPRAVVPDGVIVERYGRRTLDAWRVVQAEGERSVARDGAEGNFSHDGWQPAIDAANRFVALAATPGLVLDIGCGTLPMPAYLKVMRAAWNCEIVGVDPMLGSSRAFPFVQALGDFLPFRRGVVDAVTFVSTLDHMISPLEALRGAREVLRPGGWLLVEETVRPLDSTYIAWRARCLLGPARYNRFHNHAFRPGSLRRVVERAGFTVVASNSTSEPAERIVIAQAPQ